MTWSYGNDPSASDRDWVRFRIQDTDENAQLVSDEEIDAELAVGTKEAAAAVIARVVARRFAKQADLSEGDVSIRYGERAKRWLAIANELEGGLSGVTTPATTANAFTW